MQLSLKSCYPKSFYHSAMPLMEAHIHEEIILTYFLWKHLPVSVNLYSLVCTLGQVVIMLHDISYDLFNCQQPLKAGVGSFLATAKRKKPKFENTALLLHLCPLWPKPLPPTET